MILPFGPIDAVIFVVFWPSVFVPDSNAHCPEADSTGYFSALSRLPGSNAHSWELVG